MKKVLAALIVGFVAVLMLFVGNTLPARFSRQADTSSTPIHVGSRSPASEIRGGTPPNLSATPLPSLAPWAAFQKKFRDGDYVWIVENARSAPSQGSLSYAVQALSYCSEITFFGPEEVQIAKISSRDADSAARVTAIRKLFKACSGLGSFEQVKARRQEIGAELAATSDTREQSLNLAQRAQNGSMPSEERANIISQLLALQDGDAASALKGAITAEGVTFGGQTLSAQDRLALGFAWEMAVCRLYGSCMGQDSPRSQLDCALHGRCDFESTASAVQKYAPLASAESTASFHSAVMEALREGRYGEFGVRRK